MTLSYQLDSRALWRTGCKRPAQGTCTVGKMQRILADRQFFQHAKLNMASFVLYLLVCFALRCMMVELRPKARKIELPAGNVEGDSAMDTAFSSQHSAFSENQHQNQRPFTTEDTEATKEGKTLPLMDGKPGDEQQRVKQRAEALVRRIGEACDELDRLAEENPELVGRVARSAEEHKDAYVRLKARLELADAAPRCRWVRQDGTACGSPQMKKHIYCFAHRQMMEARALALGLPAPEDANAIQVGLMRIQKALIDDTISTKKAGLLLYSMQLALQNVGQTTFGQAKTEDLVRDTVDEEEAFSSQRSVVSENQDQTFETRRNGGSGGEEGLPLMDADDRGFKSGIRPVEWRPTPDMYRTDTPEGREAYEACLRKITARPAVEQRPMQGVAQPGAAVLHENR
jgi:hypothetical protein